MPLAFFSDFISEKNVSLIGVEAGGLDISGGKHAARFADTSIGRPGVLHGCYTYVLQNEDGQIALTHSVSAGLDYAAIGPEHTYLREQKRAVYTHASDVEALHAFKLLCEQEGIIPALEPSHALSFVLNYASSLKKKSYIAEFELKKSSCLANHFDDKFKLLFSFTKKGTQIRDSANWNPFLL